MPIHTGIPMLEKNESKSKVGNWNVNNKFRKNIYYQIDAILVALILRY